MSDNKWIVICGDIDQGYTFYGPFKDDKECRNFDRTRWGEDTIAPPRTYHELNEETLIERESIDGKNAADDDFSLGLKMLDYGPTMRRSYHERYQRETLGNIDYAIAAATANDADVGPLRRLRDRLAPTYQETVDNSEEWND